MLTRSTAGEIVILFDGRPVPATAGDTIAVALLAAGICATRTTAISASPRGPFCMMGACFECLAVVDGRAGVQTCMTPAINGMRVESQRGAKPLAAADGDTTAVDG